MNGLMQARCGVVAVDLTLCEYVTGKYDGGVGGHNAVTYQEYFVTYLGILCILRDLVTLKVKMSVQNHCDQFGITVSQNQATKCYF
jgi:hypothetical protein